MGLPRRHSSLLLFCQHLAGRFAPATSAPGGVCPPCRGPTLSAQPCSGRSRSHVVRMKCDGYFHAAEGHFRGRRSGTRSGAAGFFRALYAIFCVTLCQEQLLGIFLEGTEKPNVAPDCNSLNTDSALHMFQGSADRLTNLAWSLASLVSWFELVTVAMFS